MKRIILFLLIALSLSANAQDKKKAFLFLLNQQSSGDAYYYADLPTVPSNGGNPTTTLNSAAMGSSITEAELNFPTSKIGLVGTYTNTLRASQLVGSEVAPIIFRPTSDIDYGIIDGTALGSGVNLIGQTGATISDWIEWHKLIATGNTGVGSMTGFKWTGKAGGSNALVSDCIFIDTQSPGMQFNGDGDAGTYGNMRISFTRVSGSNTDNECFYFGDTSTSGFGIVNTLTLNDLFGYNKGWDGLQINSVENVYVNHVTIYDVGKTAASGQKSLLQAQNIGDGAIIENCIFWGAPKAFQIAGRNITFNNCIWYSDEEGFYQDVVLSAGYLEADVLSTIGGTVTFNNCQIYSGIARANGINIFEDKANFVFNNCIFGTNITTPVADSRTDTGTYSITQNNTTTAATPVTPTFNTLDFSDRDAGLVQEAFWRLTGAGYRNRLY